VTSQYYQGVKKHRSCNAQSFATYCIHSLRGLVCSLCRDTNVRNKSPGPVSHNTPNLCSTVLESACARQNLCGKLQQKLGSTAFPGCRTNPAAFTKLAATRTLDGLARPRCYCDILRGMKAKTVQHPSFGLPVSKQGGPQTVLGCSRATA